MSSYQIADALAGWVSAQQRLAEANRLFSDRPPGLRPSLDDLAALRTAEAAGWAYVVRAFREAEEVSTGPAAGGVPAAAPRPRLVVLNGPPGIGKSTLARRYADEHPLALRLDVDDVRRMLGCAAAHDRAAGDHARTLALAMARAHLAQGRDVVVPQFLAREPFLLALSDVAGATGAAFVEIVLMDSKPNALARFAARAGDADLAAHHAEAVARAGGPEALANLYDALLALVASRPDAVVVETRAGGVDEAYRRVLDIVTAP